MDGAQLVAAQQLLAEYGHAPKRWFGGDYDDVVVRSPGGWRFQSRTCSGRWQFTLDDGPIPEHRRTW